MGCRDRPRVRPRPQNRGVPRRLTAAGLLAAASLWVVAGTAGCRTDPVVDPDSGEPVAVSPTLDPDRVARILDAHRERVERLRRIHVSGVVEVGFTGAESQWTEEQVTVRMWSDDRVRTAARFQAALDTDLLWFGSDGEQTFFFDLWADPRTLCVWREGNPPPPCILQTILPPFQRPQAIADVAFADVPIPADAASRIESGPAGRTFSLVVPGRQQPVRLTWDMDLGEVVGVDVLNADGSTRLTAVLSRHVPMPLEGLSDMLAPKIPERVDARDPEGTYSLRFTLDVENSARIESQRWDRLFDLPRLRRRFRPRVVGGDVPDAGTPAG